VIVWIAPWCGIYLTDWWLRRRRCNAIALQRTGPTSPYWAHGGINWAAITAQVLGGLAAIQALDLTFLPRWLNALSSHHVADGNFPDASVFLGFGVGALAYFLLGRAVIRRQESMPKLDA
jgi:cytosine/uracil/thiamine/allantoin permease